MASSNHDDPMVVDAVTRSQEKRERKNASTRCLQTLETRAVGETNKPAETKKQKQRKKAKPKGKGKKTVYEIGEERQSQSPQIAGVASTATNQRTGNEVPTVFLEYAMMLEGSSGRTAHAVDCQCSLETLYAQECDCPLVSEVSAVNSEFDTLWLDSVCFTHVCPSSQFPWEPPTSKLGALAANGQ